MRESIHHTFEMQCFESRSEFLTIAYLGDIGIDTSARVTRLGDALKMDFRWVLGYSGYALLHAP
jgi:hypothetical protein